MILSDGRLYHHQLSEPRNSWRHTYTTKPKHLSKIIGVKGPHAFQNKSLQFCRRLRDAAQSHGPVCVPRAPGLIHHRKPEPAQVPRILHHYRQPSTATHSQAYPLVRRRCLDRNTFQQGVVVRWGKKRREAQVADGACPCERCEGLEEAVGHFGQVQVQGEPVDLRRVL